MIFGRYETKQNIAKLAKKESTSVSEQIENIMLEHLKKIQAELAASRERDAEIMYRLATIESGIARISRDEATNYSELVQDRHTVDKLRDRIERIERRLELAS
jgi:hypothetical protein